MSVANTASKMLAGVQPKYLPTASGVNVLSTIALTTSLALNDVISLLNLGADATDPVAYGPTIIGVVFDVDQLDSGGSPAITLDLGDTIGGVGQFIVSSTLAQAGGYAIPTKAGVLGYQPFASSFGTYPTASLLTDTITSKVTAAAATAKAGTMRVLIEYTYDY